jgi:hypothetical protein
VGLPLAAAFAGAGLDVTGFDISRERIAELKAGRDRTGEVSPQDFRRQNLRLSDNPADLRDHDIHIVTVPTPVDAANRPDLGPLDAACRTVGRALKASAPHNPAPIVVFESTVYPGVTEDICRPLLGRGSGHVAGRISLLVIHRADQSGQPCPSPGQHRQGGGGPTAKVKRLRELYRRSPGRRVRGGISAPRRRRVSGAARHRIAFIGK